MNTKSIDKEVLQITKGEWIVEYLGKYPKVATDEILIADLKCNNLDEAEDTAKAICKAINGTYGKGYRPEMMEELDQRLSEALGIIYRLKTVGMSIEDSVSFADKDAELQAIIKTLQGAKL